MRLDSFLAAGMFALASLAVATPAARADVQVRIDKRTQTMNVWVNGEFRHSWPVSTGRGRYQTPGGSFRAQHLAPRHYSSKYNNAPMHNAIFFKGGYAIHGTGYIRNLGRPASHGCVRLHPANAAKLYALVHRYGLKRTRITLTD